MSMANVFSVIRFVVLLSLFGFAYMAKGQTASAEAADGEMRKIAGFVRNIEAFDRLFPQEKVYLHFDNTGYFNGELIRFKAYVVRTDNGCLSDISRVLYVELVSPGGDVLVTRKLAVTDGQADGDIKLEKIFGSGFYEVRAYTRYMANWGERACFSRVFPIFHTPKEDGDYSDLVIDKVEHKKRLPNHRVKVVEGSAGASDGGGVVGSTGDGLSVNFYPEGGRVVKGLQCNMAFQAFYDGMPVDSLFSAALVDGDGNVLQDNIRAEHAGCGSFVYTSGNSECRLVVTDGNGEKRKFDLPKPVEEGCGLNVSAVVGSRIVAMVSSSRSLHGKRMGMTLMHQGSVVAFNTFTADEQPHVFRFSRADMPHGVNAITIFDSDGRIWAERMVFVYPEPSAEDSIVISPALDGDGDVLGALAPCCKVVVEAKSRPNSVFSFSAMDAGTMPNGVDMNVKSWMLLSSDLCGYIANPNYYFESDDEEHRRAADLLMMVQGWRRYDWHQMAHSDFKITQPIEDRLYLFGKLNRAKKKYDVDNVHLSVHLYNKAGEVLKGETVTDSLGYYRFALPDCNGEWTLLMHTRKEDKDVKYYVGIDRHFAPERRVLNPQEMLMKELNEPNMIVQAPADEDEMELLAADGYIPIEKRNHVLPTVKVKAKRVYDNAKAAWESESRGAYKASLYYNCDLESDAISDRGEEIPGFLEWLVRRNPFFMGDIDLNYSSQAATDMTMDQMNTDMVGELMEMFNVDAENMEALEETEQIANGEESDYANVKFRVSRSGLTYKNRPIVWIIDNSYFMTTGYGGVCEVQYSLEISNAVMMPDLLEDAKSVYISEDNEIFMRYIHSTDMKGKQPVTVFVYTHNQFFYDVKGLRRTHFQGYNEPTKFEMEDYSILPPMEDFRRTIFWEPNVRTDSEGKAKIEFYNNSSCREMFISAEGVTKDGKCMVNEW